MEGVARYYFAEFTPVAQHLTGTRGQTAPTQLSNTILGLNFHVFPNHPERLRLQVNYVFAGEDEGWGIFSPGVRPNYKGVEKEQWMTDDALLIQLQGAI